MRIRRCCEFSTLSKARPSVNRIPAMHVDSIGPAEVLLNWQHFRMARQKLGQHFLSDAGWREKIARAIRVSPHGMQWGDRSEQTKADYCWIEIGAGHGEMTEHLVRSGVPVYAVE